MTESGKTTLAKRLAKRYRQANVGVIVLDPMNDPGWNATASFTESAPFLDVVKRSKSCAVFIDESGDTIGRYNDEMFWLATKSRHYGHNAHFITQDAKQLARVVRTQCRHLFLFNSALESCDILAKDWNKPELRKAANLPAFQCYWTERFGSTRHVDLSSRHVEIP